MKIIGTFAIELIESVCPIVYNDRIDALIFNYVMIENWNEKEDENDDDES